uniref:Uncharacterized protein n=1 Tax=Solanum lycopersicum TaxID=4081 RepID=A0A3Q7IHY5_SOLLC
MGLLCPICNQGLLCPVMKNDRDYCALYAIKGLLCPLKTLKKNRGNCALYATRGYCAL